MEYRRLYGLRAPRPVGDSTFMVPQMENYSLFASPYLALNKKIENVIKGFQKIDKSDELEPPPSKIEKKSESEGETSEVNVSFGIVLNVVTVKPKELVIKLGQGNEIEVKVEQRNVHLKDRISFSRKCSYKYQLPDDVDKYSLAALRTSDDYLIILPRELLREDLLKKSIQDEKEPEESFDKELVSSLEASGSADQESDGKSKGSKTKQKKTEKRKVKDSSKPDNLVFLDGNALIPVHVSRMLRPGMDIFMLRKYMADLESYISTIRKFIENASFVTQNSKTAERCLRAIAKEKTDKFYEERNIKGQKLKSKFTKQPSLESGFGSSGNEATKLPETYDESTTSSSKSEMMQED